MTRLTMAAVVGLVVISLMSVGQSFAKIDSKSIVGAWLFDEGQGNTAKDYSGNGKNGDIQGGAKYVDGKFSKALELNGKDAWFHVPAIGTFNEITIAEWVNSTGRVGDWRVIFNNDGWKAGDVHHQLHPNNKVEFSIHSNPGGNDTFGTFLFDAGQVGKWHHLATVYNSKGGWIRFYIDGKLDIENKWGGNPAVLGPARIGSWDGGGREWQGIFDEVIIFSVALGEDDIQAIMNKGLYSMLAVSPAGKLTTTWGSIKYH